MDYFDDFSDSYTTQDFVDEIHQKWYGEEEDDDDRTFSAFLNSEWDF